MKKRTQLSIALALAAPVWLVTAYAAEHEGQMPQEQMPQQQMQGQMPQQQMQGQAGSELMGMTAGDIADMKLKNEQGKEIGDIEKVVQNKTDGKLNAVVSVGGFLGLGKKQVAVPLDQVQAQQGELVAQGLTKETLERQEAYNEQDYEAVEENATLASVTEGAPAGEGSRISFQELDKDQDGNLTPEEMQSAPQLSQNWQQYDTDQDQQISQSEFSAFEQAQQQQQPGQMQEPPMEQQQQGQQPGQMPEGKMPQENMSPEGQM